MFLVFCLSVFQGTGMRYLTLIILTQLLQNVYLQIYKKFAYLRLPCYNGARWTVRPFRRPVQLCFVPIRPTAFGPKPLQKRLAGQEEASL